mmetsp:Transcript_53867/g.89621  ORF Transcript_53867/g.89621 Transcript_53867/m.89621 type:complete len:202 (-) Transcript_53867:2106-2711(-)
MRPVGGGQDQYPVARVRPDAIHLHEIFRFQSTRGLVLVGSSRGQQGIHLINEYDAGLQGSGHGKHGAHELLALADPFGREGTRRDVEEGAVALTGDGPGQEGLTVARGAKQQQTFGGLAETSKQIGPLAGQDNAFLQNLLCIFQATDLIPLHTPGGVHHLSQNLSPTGFIHFAFDVLAGLHFLNNRVLFVVLLLFLLLDTT